MKKITIAIVDDHVTVREASEIVLNSIPEFHVIISAQSGAEFLRIIDQKNLEPNVVLMDIDMPVMNGFDTSIKFHANHPDSKILFYSTHIQELFIEKGIKCHCSGFIGKSTDSETIKNAIFEAHYTGFYHNDLFNPERIKELLKENPDDELTDREKDLVRLIYLGKTTEQIAKQMQVEIDTLYRYKNRIKHKVGLQNREDFRQFVLKSTKK